MRSDYHARPLHVPMARRLIPESDAEAYADQAADDAYRLGELTGALAVLLVAIVIVGLGMLYGWRSG